MIILNNFLNSLSAVINWLLTTMGSVTNALTGNVVFQLAAGIFLFTLVVVIIKSFINLRVGKNSIND